jgi:16S rRNA (uracil1498-N3)-methyltransferase
MPHVHRFYILPDTTESNRIELAGQELHHALHVVRVRSGDPVALFDGRGRELVGKVAEAGKRSVEIAVDEIRQVEKPSVRVQLLMAGLHRDKAIEEAVRRGTELGVVRFCFYKADRSDRAPRYSDKWTRWAIESCKQCGRVWLPEFEVADSLEAALDPMPERLLIATRDESPQPLDTAANRDDIGILIGPEGDFTDAERALAIERGAIPITLGPHTYRAEVAAILAATLTLYERGALGN